MVVKYSLKGYNNDIVVSDWESKIMDSFPKKLEGSLTTIEEIEKELEIIDFYEK